jgi:hypothetical protein
MPFDVPLSRKLKAEGWKAKIREKERVDGEPGFQRRG